MKIKSRASGDVIDINDEGARTLVDAGIYDAVADPQQKEPQKPAPQKTPEKPTKVAPMTTEDMPTVPTKKGK